MMNEMQGVCFLFSETGTEGGWWAMREDGLAEGDGDLRSLEDGDDFTVYADDNSVLFHGIIHQDTTTGAVPRRVLHDGTPVMQQVVGGMWVHWIQKGMDPEAWGQLFVGNKRCLLRREESAAREIAELKADIDLGSVGIVSREAYKKRTIAIANGENVPAEGEPKVWVESLGTLSQARSDRDFRLLAGNDQESTSPKRKVKTGCVAVLTAITAPRPLIRNRSPR